MVTCKSDTYHLYQSDLFADQKMLGVQVLLNLILADGLLSACNLKVSGHKEIDFIHVVHMFLLAV